MKRKSLLSLCIGLMSVLMLVSCGDTSLRSKLVGSWKIDAVMYSGVDYLSFLSNMVEMEEECKIENTYLLFQDNDSMMVSMCGEFAPPVHYTCNDAEHTAIVDIEIESMFTSTVNTRRIKMAYDDNMLTFPLSSLFSDEDKALMKASIDEILEQYPEEQTAILQQVVGLLTSDETTIIFVKEEK